MLKRDDNAFFNVIYGILWPTKRGKPLLVDQVAADCRQLILEVCAERQWQVLRLDIQPNHVLLVASVDPDSSPKDVLITCRDRSSILFHRYPALKRSASSLWTRNFAIMTLAPDTDVENLVLLEPEEMADLIKMAKLW